MVKLDGIFIKKKCKGRDPQLGVNPFAARDVLAFFAPKYKSNFRPENYVNQ